MRWPRRHAIATPFGVFAVTTLLTWWISGQWLGPDNGKLAADLVPLAGVIYGMMALTVEGGVRLMFWAWEKHQAVRESWRVEGAKAGRKAERAATEAHLEKVSKETGIPLERLLPPQRE